MILFSKNVHGYFERLILDIGNIIYLYILKYFLIYLFFVFFKSIVLKIVFLGHCKSTMVYNPIINLTIYRIMAIHKIVDALCQ